MDNQELIRKYQSGKLTPHEKRLLETGIESGEITIEELDDLQAFKEKLDVISHPEPSLRLSDKFYAELDAAKQKAQRSDAFGGWFSRLWTAQPVLRWAYSIGLVIIGVGAGLLLQTEENNDVKLENLSAEVGEMKELMMLTLLDKDSPSDRLKAVNLTSEMPDASTKVTEALIKTLNNDENVNVRLATLEALYPYASHPQVREELIRSIAVQKSPLVQMALAEVMVALQEKRSVKNLKKVLQNESTPPEIRERIEKSIEVLI